MANIDSIYNLIPTSTPLLFADLCSGPGGFAEYILWKSKQSKGWGITLRGNQDYKFVNQKFIPVYGDGSGDLYKVANIDLFVDRVLKDTMKESESIAKGGGGADLCLGDGGFSVLGDEQYVEHHSRHLILSQILTMFSILRKGGNFVLKVFDILTNFSVEAVYLLYLFFEKISIIKPFSSRSGNSERYLVCLNLQVQRPTDLIEYLKTVLTCFNDLKPTLKQPKSAHSTHQPGFVRREEMIELGLLEVTDILDIDKVVKDEVFIDAITGSNMK